MPPAHEPSTSDQRFPVVAVGASAGGLEAFTELLDRLPTRTGMAFVFIQHLAPSHESMLPQLLSRQTAMPVHQVEDGTVLSPNHVYVIPPNAGMTISGLQLALQPRLTSGAGIDAFLRSLAVSHKGRAVAVILSGTGSDGALGVQAIAEEGGIVFAQDPASAKFDGMPRSAIATGCVDFVLPPDGIAAELASIASEGRFIDRDTSELAVGSEADFQAVLHSLRAATGIDFSHYRRTTVKRRMLRRAALLRQGSLHGYVQHVKENPDEVHALAQDILIRVTRFFRDPEAFEALSRKVFPTLIRKTPPDRAVRIWVAGCSTGEEAYSIAICFMEVAEQMRSRLPVQVFATDVNEAAIEKARRGTYIENIVADVSPERLARFFVRNGREFQVGRTLRDLCIFSRHDLLNDPPFSRMDLVSCRNVLIYLDSMQEQALSRFHFALNPGRFLLLGKSETAGSAPELFAPLDKAARLFVRQESARHPAPTHGKHKKAASLPRQQVIPEQARQPRRIDLRSLADRLVLGRYGPPRVIVNANLVPFSGEIAGFRMSGSDIESRKILEAIENTEADALRNAIREATESGQSVRIERVKVADSASPREMSIEVTPLGPDRQHFLIVFEEHAAPEVEASERSARQNGKFPARISHLEKELAASRAHLESVILDQESANEEIVAGNEELQSMNEELQSSKEELEASNEELTTVNQELEVRNTELESAREFAQATIDTVRGSLVVLGPDLRVLKANQSFYRTFRLSPAEVEHRFIYELGSGYWRTSQLRTLLEEILPKSRVMEDFEIDHETPSGGGRRILLLNARRFEREERILLAIEDVTQSRRLEEELRQSQKMEAIGYLAAGVAHDFNNLLTGVIGHASMMADDLPEDDHNRAGIESILSSAQRAADLTRQLLAYAGKGRFYVERVNLSDAVIETARLIHPSIPVNVQLRLDLDRNLPLLLADAGQMQQVVMNLLINSAEAIGDAHGSILVKTGSQTVTDEPLPDLYLKETVAPGQYIFLEVQDNGPGMDEQTIRRIFDPFFTTKFTGRGLGLAAVQGIVRQHKGAVQLHSVPGRGTLLKVLFPVAEELPYEFAEDVGPEDLRDTGTILVVDDEEVIRNFTRSALERFGYTVLLAQDGEEAIRAFRERCRDIRLVVLDVAMPGMNGMETLGHLRQMRNDVPVLVSSGLGDVNVETQFAGDHVAGFLQKPYTVKQLAAKVKECITPAGSV